jgi:putative FmdB family regulatory protein
MEDTLPTYNFICQTCHKKFEVVLSYAEYGKNPVACPHCRSSSVRRRIGRVRMAKSDESRLENFANPANLNGIDQDPQSLGKMMRHMSSETGENLGPEFDEVVGRLEKGQSPEQIEKELPNLGTDASFDGYENHGSDDL